MILCCLVPEDVEAQVEDRLLRLIFCQQRAQGAAELRMVTDLNHRHRPQDIRLFTRPERQAVGPKQATEGNDVSGQVGMRHDILFGQLRC